MCFFSYDFKKIYDTAEIEKEFNSFRADVLLSSSNIPHRDPVFMEIEVTHPCDEKKINSGNRIIEIKVEKEEDAWIDFKDSNPSIKFYNFSPKCKYYAEKIIEASQLFKKTGIVQEVSPQGTVRYYCSPPINNNLSIQDYYDRLKNGIVFASDNNNRYTLFCRAKTTDEKAIIVLCKVLNKEIPWYLFRIECKDKYYHSYISSHNNYKEAIDFFNIEIQKEQ